MVDLLKLLDDVASMMRSCPMILAELDDAPDAILAYADEATSPENSLTRAIYSQPNGTILIAWQATGLPTDMGGFSHHLDFYVRALRRESPLSLLKAIMDGVPVGDTLRWRYKCVNEFVDPMQVEEIARLTDEEGVDFYVIRASFREKGDYV